MTNEKLNRSLSGRVISNKMDKTITVLVERRIKHELYGKYITRSKKYHAHSGDVQLEIGNIVQIEECRPISKTKKWKLVKLLDSSI